MPFTLWWNSFRKEIMCYLSQAWTICIMKSVKTQIAKDVKIPSAVYPNFWQNVSNHPVILWIDIMRKQLVTQWSNRSWQWSKRGFITLLQLFRILWYGQEGVCEVTKKPFLLTSGSEVGWAKCNWVRTFEKRFGQRLFVAWG